MTTTLRTLVVAALATALLLFAGPALAHVTLRTDNPAPEAFSKYTVRVPTESETAATVKVEVQMPEGFTASRYQPVEGWDISISDGVLTIEGGRIEPGEFQEFSFSAQNPPDAGDLVFPSIQTYDDGEEVRWVGEPDTDEPAPIVTIEGEPAGHGHGDDDEHNGADTAEPTDPGEDVTEPADTETAAPEPPEEDVAAPDTTETAASGTDPLAIVALVAGLLGLGLGGAALARSRR